MIVNLIVTEITKVSRTSPQNNSETVTNEEENIGRDREISRERYIFPEKIINLLDNTPNQPSKSRIKNWIDINDESRGMYDANIFL